MLKVMNTNLSTIQSNDVHVQGFDSIAKKKLGIITLPIKVGPLISDTPIVVILGPLTYKIPLG